MCSILAKPRTVRQETIPAVRCATDNTSVGCMHPGVLLCHALGVQSSTRRARFLTISIGLVATLAACSSGSDSAADTTSTTSIGSTPGSVVVTTPESIAEVATSESSEPATTAAATEPTTTAAPTTAAPTTAAPTTAAPTTAAPTTAAPTTAAPTSAPAENDGLLRLGDEGEAVGDMQFKLAILGYLPTGSDDGVFDEETEAGLKKFQEDYDLGADGVFGAVTGRSLNAALQSVDVGN